MKKSRIFPFPIGTILLVFFLGNLYGQTDDFGVIFWSKERNLDWEDFKGTSLIDTSKTFYLDLYIESANANSGDGFFLMGSLPTAYVYTLTSFVDEEIRSDDLLRYLNVYFDLAGYYAYKMTKNLADATQSEQGIIKNNPRIVQNAVIEEWRTECTRLATETRYGIEIERLIFWEMEVENLINSIKEPTVSVSDYALTFDLTVGPLIGLNDYNRYLTKPTSGVLSMEIKKRPYVFSFGLSGGGQTVKETFEIGNDQFLEGTEPNILNLFLHSGYQILDTKRFRIIPRLGFHFSNLRYPRVEDNDGNIWEVNLTTGLTTDIKLKRWSSQNPMGPVMSDISLRVGAYYYPMKRGDVDLSHMLISAGISWTIGGGRISYR